MKLKLTAKKKESADVTSFIFRPLQPTTWIAGQYLHYVLNHQPTDDRGSDRWFTIASAPHEGHVMLTTRFAKKKGSSFKSNLHALKIGDEIEFSDLDGDFIVKDYRKEYVFIAGGIGITPFRAILRDAEHKGKPLRATLVYANRKEVAAYKAELEAMSQRNPGLKICYLFHPRRLDKASLKQLVPDFKRPLFYISGPEPMVEAVSEILGKLGVPKKNLKMDWFPGYPAD